MDNASDRKAIRKAEKVAEQTQLEDDAVLGHLMDTVQGRAWIWRWLERCDIFGSQFNPNHAIEAFSLGQANIGKQLLAEIIRVAPDAYIQAMREANERHQSRRTRPGTEDGSSDGERSEGEGSGRDVEGSDAEG